jgi:hypothetical protein
VSSHSSSQAIVFMEHRMNVSLKVVWLHLNMPLSSTMSTGPDVRICSLCWLLKVDVQEGHEYHKGAGGEGHQASSYKGL